MHFYSHNIGDFNNATRHLTRVERSLYRDLIELYYDSEQPLQSVNKDKLARRVLAQTEEELTALAYVLDEFFQEFDGNYNHARCDSEIAKYHTNTSAKAKAGIASAKARQTKREQDSTGVEQPLDTCATKQETITNKQELITNKQKTKTNTKSIVEAKPQRVDHVQPIFDYWVETMGKTAGSKLTAGRRKCVEARLREGYTPEQIKLAITGCSKSPHHMGQNDTGSIYDELTLICRKGENVERFSQITATPNQANPIIINGGFNHGPNQQQPSRGTSADRQRTAAQQLVNSL